MHVFKVLELKYALFYLSFFYCILFKTLISATLIDVLGETCLRAQVSARISILLEIGTMGYLIGAAACAFYWFMWVWLDFMHRHFVFVANLVYPLTALGLILAGLGCFALGKLYEMHARAKWLAITTGILYIITAVPFFLTNNLLYNNPPLGSLEFNIAMSGFGLLIISLFMWAITGVNIAKLSHHTRLASAMICTSSIVAALTLFGFHLGMYWGPRAPPLYLFQFYFVAQILSALMLHKIRLQHTDKT